MFLQFDQETGEVTGHEGRHRMQALLNDGIERVAITLFPDGDKGRCSRTRITDIKLTGQYFNERVASGEVMISEALPLSREYEQEVRVKFGQQDSAVKFSISEGMTDSERYEELKNAELRVASFDADASKLTPAEVTRLEDATRRDARRYTKTLFDKFGVGKRYENQNADIEFTFSGMGFDKSIYEQNARTADYAAFGKMLSCFDEIIENAVPIDIHGDKYRNTARADADLKNVFVLVSAYRDNGVVPVQPEVKEFIEKDNSLYVAVTLHKIKDAVFTKESASNEAPAMAAHIFIISLRDLFANIKTDVIPAAPKTIVRYKVGVCCRVISSSIFIWKGTACQ